MFLTYLLIAALAAGTVISISFAVSYFMTLSDMKSNIMSHDTNNATKAAVEDVIGSAISSAKTVEVGLFKGGDRVGNVTIDCPKGTNVRKGDYIYI